MRPKRMKKILYVYIIHCLILNPLESDKSYLILSQGLFIFKLFRVETVRFYCYICLKVKELSNVVWALAQVSCFDMDIVS